MTRTRIATFLIATLLVAACQATADTPPNAEPVAGLDRIEMRDNAFDPPVVQVPVNTTVTWAFTDGGRPHNVVGDGFESDVLSEGTFTHTFTTPGTYDYRCTLHRDMDGRVIVTAR